MTETFLILLAAGILLSAAISDPSQVTLNWLRLAGILALSMTGLGLYFMLTREARADTPAFFQNLQLGEAIAVVVFTLGQLAFVQIGWRRIQRVLAMLGSIAGVLAGTALLHELMILRGSAANFPPKLLSMSLQTLTCGGVAALCGLALMDMLLGHAYLTASRMSIHPLARLNRSLAIAMILRALFSVGAAVALHQWRPVPMLWGVHGLLIITRWMVGLLVAGIFVYMAHDCIRRRSTQSATGILYVAGVLIFIGEIIALHLTRETGLPF